MADNPRHHDLRGAVNPSDSNNDGRLRLALMRRAAEAHIREGLLQTGVRSVLIKPVTIGELAAGIALSLGRDAC